MAQDQNTEAVLQHCYQKVKTEAWRFGLVRYAPMPEVVVGWEVMQTSVNAKQR